MPDDHSDLVPLLPIPNRTVKRVSADDSADTRVKVGHRQAITARKRPTSWWGVFFCLFVAYFPTLNSRFSIFPTLDLGNSSRNSI